MVQCTRLCNTVLFIISASRRGQTNRWNAPLERTVALMSCNVVSHTELDKNWNNEKSFRVSSAGALQGCELPFLRLRLRLANRMIMPVVSSIFTAHGR